MSYYALFSIPRAYCRGRLFVKQEMMIIYHAKQIKALKHALLAVFNSLLFLAILADEMIENRTVITS